MHTPMKTTHADDGLDLAVYLGLLSLTAITLAAGLLSHHGRVLAVSVALIIAGAKASLIGFYYMGLRRERLLTWAIVAIGVLAVAILLAGILPDASFRRL